jgi:hypothetical protein
MPYARIDDNFYMTVKNQTIDRDEQDLFFAGNVYCNQQLTDGFIPASVLPHLALWAKLPHEANAQAIASRLIEHRYWEKVDGGYIVHDYLDWNMSKAEILSIREARSKAGKRGGERSGAARRALAEANEANAEANAQAKPKQNRSNTTINTNTTSSNNDDDAGGGVDNFSAGMAGAVRAYENAIGVIAGADQANEIADAIEELEKKRLLHWWASALKIACDNNARSWSYVRAIITNSLATGKAPGTDKPSRNGRSNGRKVYEVHSEGYNVDAIPADLRGLIKS